MKDYMVLGINEFVLRDKFSMAINWGLIALAVVAVVYFMYALIKRKGVQEERRAAAKKQRKITEKREKIEREKFIKSLYDEIDKK